MFWKFQPALGRNLQKVKAKFKQEALRANRYHVCDTGQAKGDGSLWGTSRSVTLSICNPYIGNL